MLDKHILDALGRLQSGLQRPDMTLTRDEILKQVARIKTESLDDICRFEEKDNEFLVYIQDILFLHYYKINPAEYRAKLVSTFAKEADEYLNSFKFKDKRKDMLDESKRTAGARTCSAINSRNDNHDTCLKLIYGYMSTQDGLTPQDHENAAPSVHKFNIEYKVGKEFILRDKITGEVFFKLTRVNDKNWRASTD